MHYVSKFFKSPDTLYNSIRECPRLPRRIQQEGLETGFCALLPKNSAEL